MIKEIIYTILPTLLVLLFLFATLKIAKRVELNTTIKAFLLGMMIVLPAIVTLRLLGIILTITLPVALPIILYRILSALNEETFKYFAINKFLNKDRSFFYALFIGGGFALCETVYLSIGYRDMALNRTFTTLPLHIITSLLQSKAGNRKRYFFLALLLHLSYNLFLSSF